MYGPRLILRLSPVLRSLTVRRSTTDALDDPKVASKMKKYGLISAPFVVAGLITSMVCMSETVRDFTEEHFPAYVRFLRHYIGFSGEDLVEKERLKALSAAVAKPVSVKLHFESGDIITLDDVDGASSYNKFLSIAEEQHGKIRKVEFLDAPSAHVTSSINSSDTSLPDIHFNPIHFTNSAATPLQLPSIQDQETMARPSTYLNHVVYVMLERLQYAGLLKRRETKKVQKSTYNDTTLQKMLVIESIQNIEKRIAALEKEKFSVGRDIDSINEEIAAAQNEIVQLKRKYLNFFYYF